jgi:glutamate carboxypeptidase
MSRRFALRPVALLAASLLSAGTAFAAPDAKLFGAAQQQQPAVIESLKEMVSIESGSGTPDGLAKMADYTEKRLRALGAKTERLKASRGSNPIVKGVFTGTGKARLMLIAHMDTVYPAGTLATQPIRLDGNKLYGPGIADDKGGIAVVLHSLKILQDAGWRNYAQLTVLFNADEEIGSTGSGETIATLADEHEVVLSFEPTAAKDVAKTEAVLLGAAGTATATMEVKGRSAHAGAAPQLGRNALVELSHQVLQTRDVAKDIPGTQLNWTTAAAGQVRNQIPEKAVATGDVRLTAPNVADKLQAALQAKVDGNRLVPDTQTTVSIEVGRPPFVAGDASRTLAQRAQAIYAELDGRTLTLVPSTGGATDAGFAGRSGKAVVLESFGLAGFGYHARDEYIEIDSIVPRLYLVTRLLGDLGNDKR